MFVWFGLGVGERRKGVVLGEWGRLFGAGSWVLRERRQASPLIWFTVSLPPLNPNKKFNVAQRRIDSLITRHGSTLKTAGFK